MENEKWIQVIAREGKVVFETIETGNTGIQSKEANNEESIQI